VSPQIVIPRYELTTRDGRRMQSSDPSVLIPDDADEDSVLCAEALAPGGILRTVAYNLQRLR